MQTAPLDEALKQLFQLQIEHATLYIFKILLNLFKLKMPSYCIHGMSFVLDVDRKNACQRAVGMQIGMSARRFLENEQSEPVTARQTVDTT